MGHWNQKMRSEILTVKTDIASQMVQAGEFVTPAPDLTVYTREIRPDGELLDVLIHDGRDPESKSTHTAKTGRLQRSDTFTSLILFNGTVQTPLADGSLDVIDFETYQLDLSDIVALDNVLRLKSSDRFLHELLEPNPREYITPKSRGERAAEGHARLAAPLWNVALVLLALAFILRGQHSKLGNSRKIAICAITGFTLRLAGFAIASSAESDSALNPVQYILPILIIILCLARATLSRYIAGRTLRGIGVALLIVTAIIALVDYVEASRTIGTEADLSPLDLLTLTVLKIPKLIEQTIPFVVLFGVMGALAGMNKRSELTVMRAAGLSAWRFLRPAMILSALIGIVWSTIINPLSSQMMGEYDARSAEMTDSLKTNEIWLREGSETAQRVYLQRN